MLKWTQEQLSEIEEAAADIDAEKAEMAKELKRLQIIAEPTPGALEAMKTFQTKRAAARAPVQPKPPELTTRDEELARARYSVIELEEAHRKSYARVLELENAQEKALEASKKAGAYGAILAALRSVPRCGACRDDPKNFKPNPGKCTRCGAEAKGR